MDFVSTLTDTGSDKEEVYACNKEAKVSVDEYSPPIKLPKLFRLSTSLMLLT